MGRDGAWPKGPATIRVEVFLEWLERGIVVDAPYRDRPRDGHLGERFRSILGTGKPVPVAIRIIRVERIRRAVLVGGPCYRTMNRGLGVNEAKREAGKHGYSCSFQ